MVCIEPKGERQVSVPYTERLPFAYRLVEDEQLPGIKSASPSDRQAAVSGRSLRHENGTAIGEGMVWDLGKAMRKKEEFESARLMDFEFRLRARATKLLARAFALDEATLVREIASQTEVALLDMVARDLGRSRDEVASEYSRCLSEARKQLMIERGDPTPYRLG